MSELSKRLCEVGSSIVICDKCGNKFKKTNSAIRRSVLHFCCKECWNTYGLKKNTILVKEKYAEIIINSKKYGNQICIIDVEDIGKIQEYTWSLRKDNNNLYVISNGLSKKEKKTVLIHRLILNLENGIIDHINRNALDNRKQNLRVCSRSQNRLNSRLNKNNSSGYKGIYYMKNADKWQARIKIDGREKSLGYFKNVKDAIKVRKLAEYFYWEYLPKILKAEKDKMQDALLKLCTKLAPEIKEEVKEIFDGN